MLLHAITLDAAMSVSETRARLARYGLWLSAEQPEAQAWIAEYADRLRLSFDEAARRLARDPAASAQRSGASGTPMSFGTRGGWMRC